jgi:hypothetical protein
VIRGSKNAREFLKQTEARLAARRKMIAEAAKVS